MRFAVVAGCLAALSWAPTLAAAEGLSLSGTWRVRLDDADAGLAAQWFVRPLATTATARLPGSLAASGLGHPFDPLTGRYAGVRRPYLKWPSAGYTDDTRVDELGALVPERFYFGPAWFERRVKIPAAWAKHPLRLTLERVKWTSRLWVDGREIKGHITDSLYTPHVYEISPLAPGGHRFTLRIDNRPALNLGWAGHGYGMETETLWNGVAGTLKLEPLNALRFDTVRILPQLDGTVRIAVTGQGAKPRSIRVRARLRGPDGRGGRWDVAQDSPPVSCLASASGGNVTFSTDLVLTLPDSPRSWDEFHPTLYRLEVSLRTDDGPPLDTRTLRIGFREVARDGRRLLLNGAPLFLRGTLDCAIHPNTDTPPTDRAWWVRVLGIYKQAGFNHVRFHTWCPPEVAFDVADELGLYFEVETVYWVDNWIHDTAPHPPRLGEDPAVAVWVQAEATRILRAYGHHPSLLLFCIGNEFGMKSDWATVDRIVAALGQETDTALVTGCTARKTGAHDQYWVTHATTKGIRGIGPAHTDWDFSAGVQAADKPVISHETGQRQSWPDYSALLPAFRGVAQPHNLERLRQRAEEVGITDHHARAAASVALAHRLYKAEQEALRRTPGLAGYQLLMLHDFTGQGEALVGLLDPFYREKPGISLAAIRQWNGPTVPLARFRSYLWTTGQSFAARLQLAHQGPGSLGPVRPQWTLRDRSHHRRVAAGVLAPITASPGRLTPLGEVEISLANVTAPARLDFTVEVGDHVNSWPVWVYPPAGAAAAGTNAEGQIHVAHRLDAAALRALKQGETVLLLFHQAAGKQFRRTRWAGTYWTGAWGWGRGLGLMCDPRHPALAGFPNEGHTDWQWRELAEGATCVRLDPPASAGIIVEQLSTFHHPAHEALLFEARVGPGRLLACGFDLERNLAPRHAARAFRESLMRYAGAPLRRAVLKLAPVEAVALFSLPKPATASSPRPAR